MIPLPGEVRAGVEAALEERGGRPTRIAAATALGGGCVNPAARVEFDRGEVYFLKWNPTAPPALFEAEANGLEALARAARGTGLRVPGVVAVGEEARTSWLLLEFIERGTGGAGWGRQLGRGLAALHRALEGEQPAWGWERDNFIGSLPQSNRRTSGWAAFWRDRRLVPQLELARRSGSLTRRESAPLDKLLARVDDALAPVAAEGPSLLHGDLWGGNVYAGPAGEGVLVDPAVYRGHREVDLAMSELFGGLPPDFEEAYREAWPLQPSYREVRRPLYQLYYLLVHVNLFGSGYVAGTLQAAREVLRRL